MSPAEAEALAKQIEDLSPPDKLRLAAGLLEHRKAELACAIARLVADELGSALALAKHGKGKDR